MSSNTALPLKLLDFLAYPDVLAFKVLLQPLVIGARTNVSNPLPVRFARANYQLLGNDNKVTIGRDAYHLSPCKELDGALEPIPKRLRNEENDLVTLFARCSLKAFEKCLINSFPNISPSISRPVVFRMGAPPNMSHFWHEISRNWQALLTLIVSVTVVLISWLQCRTAKRQWETAVRQSETAKKQWDR